MNKKIKYLPIVFLLSIFTFVFTACDSFMDLFEEDEPEYTWSFEYYSPNGSNYIEVWPTDGKPSHFILNSSNTYQIVTYKGSQGGFRYTSHYSGTAPYYQSYTALQEVVFYDD